MATWKTFLILYFGDKGVKPTDITKKINGIGFETRLGTFDFSYNWGEKEPSKESILALGDKVADTVKDTGIIFALDTHD